MLHFKVVNLITNMNYEYELVHLYVTWALKQFF